MSRKLVKASSKKQTKKVLSPQEAREAAKANGEKWTTEQGNPRIYIVVLVILIATILFAWARNVTTGYVDSFVLNGADGADAISGNDALLHTQEEQELLKPLQLSWDGLKNSVLWDQVTTTDATGCELYGKLYNAEAKRTVLVFGQFGENSESDFLYGPFFAEEGYNILMVDFRGTGNSAASANGFGLLEQKDVAAWVSYVNNSLGGDLILYGKGLGANAILYYSISEAYSKETNINGLICESPYNSIEEEMTYTLKNGYGLSGVFFKLMKMVAERKDLGYSLDNSTLAECVATLSNVEEEKQEVYFPRALFLIGNADDYIPAANSQASYDAYPGAKQLISAEVRHDMIYANQKEEIEKALLDIAR